MVTEKLGYALTSSSRLLKTENGGNSWVNLSAAGSVAADSGTSTFCVLGDKIILIAADIDSGIEVKKSVDGGGSWTKSVIKCSSDDFDSGYGGNLSLNFVSQSDGFLLTESLPAGGLMSKVLYKTTDGGSHWSRLGKLTGINGYPTGMAFSDTGTGFITCTYHGQKEISVYRTADAGKSWHTVSLPLPEKYTFMSDGHDYYADAYPPSFFENGAKMELCFCHNGEFTPIMYDSTDGGATWRINGTGNRLMKQYCFFNEKKGFGLDESGTFYETKDGGATWQPV
jgi:Uncharacterized protein related to plant photosystem II stability/assembly factor